MVMGTDGGVTRAASARCGSESVHARARAVEHATSRVRRAINLFDALESVMGSLFRVVREVWSAGLPAFLPVVLVRSEVGPSCPACELVTFRTQTPSECACMLMTARRSSRRGSAPIAVDARYAS